MKILMHAPLFVLLSIFEKNAIQLTPICRIFANYWKYLFLLYDHTTAPTECTKRPRVIPKLAHSSPVFDVFGKSASNMTFELLSLMLHNHRLHCLYPN